MRRSPTSPRAGPDVVVTIDSPGFTLRACCARSRRSACRACTTSRRRSGPGVEGRVRHYGGLWDRLLCLLPFEPAFFARHDLPATFVGHPVLESGADTGDAARFRARHGIDPTARVLTRHAGQPAHRGHAAAAGVRRRVAAVCRMLVPVVPVAGPVAEAVAAGARDWPRPPILLTDVGGQARRLRCLGRGADQVRHLDAGAGDGGRADGGRAIASTR